MENLKTNANYTYEEEPEWKEADARDVTNERLSGIGKGVRDAVSKIYKGIKYYKVVFKEGYTQYGASYRYARNTGEIGFVCMGATEEKNAIQNGEARDMAYYMDSFKKNKIHTNGKDIPTFIDLEEDWQKAQEKLKDKEQKSEKVKADTKEVKVAKESK